MSLKRGWDRISCEYQRRMRIPADDVYWGEFVTSESKLRILGDVKSKKILEIGCGGAQNSIALSKWGAEAYGIDLSEKQILYGKQLARNESVRVNLIVGDMENLPFRNETFDLVTTAISLHYVRRLPTTMAEVNRVLEMNGYFTFSIQHPLADGKLARRKGKPAVIVTDYFKRRTIHWREKLPDGSQVRMHSYYRTMQDYFDALTGNGFVIERYVELERLGKDALHALDREDISKRPEARRLYGLMKHMPYWVILKARKSAGG